MEAPGEVRAAIRRGEWTGPTAGPRARLRAGQPRRAARRPTRSASCASACATRSRARCSRSASPARPSPTRLAPGADLRTDLPGYRVWRDGELAEERADIRELWREDLVAFLIGCSFTFERALLAAGLPVRHVEQGVNVPMYRTSRACAPAGRFSGPLVVSMRPMTPPQALRAAEITARYPEVHGAPVHAGDPAELGIADLAAPDYGDAVEVREGEIPVFWACGVTPQAAAVASRPELMITHAPGHMFVSDERDAAGPVSPSRRAA